MPTVKIIGQKALDSEVQTLDATHRSLNTHTKVYRRVILRVNDKGKIHRDFSHQRESDGET